jgi:hypothetical protein
MTEDFQFRQRLRLAQGRLRLFRWLVVPVAIAIEALAILAFIFWTGSPAGLIIGLMIGGVLLGVGIFYLLRAPWPRCPECNRKLRELYSRRHQQRRTDPTGPDVDELLRCPYCRAELQTGNVAARAERDGPPTG